VTFRRAQRCACTSATILLSFIDRRDASYPHVAASAYVMPALIGAFHVSDVQRVALLSGHAQQLGGAPPAPIPPDTLSNRSGTCSAPFLELIARGVDPRVLKIGAVPAGVRRRTLTAVGAMHAA